MTKEKRKKQIRSRIIILAVLLIVIAGAGIWIVERYVPSNEHMEAAEYFGLSGDEAAVCVDGVVSETKGRLINGEVCPDLGSVRELLNPAVFYEDSENELIVTTPTEKKVYPFENGVAADGNVVMLDGEIYLKPAFLNENAAMISTVYTEPARLVARTQSRVVMLNLHTDAPMRRLAGIKSPILADMTAGMSVQALDVDADGFPVGDKVDGWTHVLSEDGFSGYIEDRFLDAPYAAETEIPDPVGVYTTRSLDGFVNMAFHQTTSQAANNALSSVISSVSGVNVIAPTWFFLKNNAGEMSSLASRSYVDTAHAAGLKVWAVMNDFDGEVTSAESTAAAISSEASRNTIISTVISELQACGADGLNVDFELVKSEAAPDFLELIRELSIACRNAGLTLSVDNYVPTFTAYMNRKEQARVVDYIVTMCYDEHTSGSTQAGSVSSISFVRKGITDTLVEVPEEKLIAAIPFYTRLWKTDGTGSVSSTAYGMGDAQQAAEASGMDLTWDENTGQYYGEQNSGDILIQIWMEEVTSIGEKMDVIREAGCAGVAEWKLGLEDSSVWAVIAGQPAG